MSPQNIQKVSAITFSFELQGAGLRHLSMAQLDVLEALHHAALATVADRRLELVSVAAQSPFAYGCYLV